ncbi:MAG: SRPBCC family protein [Gemmatimonas sp.]
MPVSRVANSETFAVSTPSAVEIRLERLFNASPDLLFDAITKPEHVVHWWGCLDDRYSMRICEIDLRVGGKWRFALRGPDGDIPAFYGTYSEIVRPDHLVNTEFFEPFPDAGSVVMTTLTVDHGKTRLVLLCTYPSQQVRDMVLASGMEHGAAVGYDRLEERAAWMAGGTASSV